MARPPSNISASRKTLCANVAFVIAIIGCGADAPSDEAMGGSTASGAGTTGGNPSDDNPDLSGGSAQGGVAGTLGGATQSAGAGLDDDDMTGSDDDTTDDDSADDDSADDDSADDDSADDDSADDDSADDDSADDDSADDDSADDDSADDDSADDDTAVDDGPAEIHWVGRFQQETSGDVRLSWSGSGFVIAFEGTELSVDLDDDGENMFSVVVDDVPQAPLTLTPGAHTYQLVQGLPEGVHRVEVYKRTEPSFGTTTFSTYDLGPEGVLISPPRPEKRLEVIGDSITCGYGNEGESATCSFTAETENHYLTYAAIAARELGAELSTVAWSGKGVVYNYGDDKIDPMPLLYDRAIANEAESLWDYPVAVDAVIINLGTNDFSTDGDPSADEFETAYVNLLERVRGHYPDAAVVATVGPLLSGEDLTAARAGIGGAIARLQESGDNHMHIWEMDIPNSDPGCDYHPGLATHQAMGTALAAELAPLLGN